MTHIIDRRPNASKKSTVNRQRFLRRYKDQIKEAVAQAVLKRGVTDLHQGEKIIIPTKDLSEPFFSKAQGGYVEQVLPGNDRYHAGDTIERPASESSDASQQGDASQDGPQEESFSFDLTREEFLDIYFDDLALPHLVKKELAQMPMFKTIRAGVTVTGMPTHLHLGRSMRQAMARRIATTAAARRKIAELQAELVALDASETVDEAARQVLMTQIASQSQWIKKVPFLDNMDLRYHHRLRVLEPSTQAVMFCLMDVSGSMDQTKKEMAKRFFMLLYLFLNKHYQKIEVVFIRHHTSAKEVGEEEFFYSRETGGTVVSSALELLHHTILDRYPSSLWNIYVAQASDGDNWNADSPYCLELLKDKIMPMLQYYAYIEIMPRHHQSLWDMYAQLAKEFPQFSMENIDTPADIYPVFRSLFKRKSL